MPKRFLHPGKLDSPQVQLSGTEAHHLLHVLRGQVGDEVVLFNGEGLEARARIIAVKDSGEPEATLEILSLHSASSEPRRPIILATAVPKGDRFEWLVEKATELGVTRLIPLLAERSIVNPGTGKLEKLRHSVVAASKQSGRNRLMEINAPLSWNQFLKDEVSEVQFCLADPYGEPLVNCDWSGDQPILLAIGPEGGFTENEIATARARGAQSVRLGQNILRIETAAVALASAVVAFLETTVDPKSARS